MNARRCDAATMVACIAGKGRCWQLQDCQYARATIAQAERQFHSALYLRAQVGQHYAIYRGRA